jgi:hypothetical protein
MEANEKKLLRRAKIAKALYKLRRVYWTVTHPAMLILLVACYQLIEMIIGPTWPSNANILGTIVIIAIFVLTSKNRKQ